VGPPGEADHSPARNPRLTLEPISLQELVRYVGTHPTPAARQRTSV
jgi:hypothetical protein